MNFPALLRTAAVDCNKARKPLGIAILIVGVISIGVTLLLWSTLLRSGMAELRTLLGPDVAASIETQVMGMTPGPQMQGVMMDVMSKVKATFDAMSEEEREQAGTEMMVRLMGDVAPVFIGFIVLSAIMKLWTGSFFLLLGIRKNPRFGTLAGEAITWMLPVLGVGFMIGLAAVGWMIGVGILAFILSFVHEALAPLTLIIVGVGGLITFGPRLCLAPVLLLQDDAGVIGSIKRSFRITKGRWLKVVGNLIGAAAMVWIALFLVQFVLNIVMNMVPSAPFALVVGQLLVFATLLGTAYQTVFLVRLKEAIARK